MPLFVPNTSGVKVPICTSITLRLYFLFFSFSRSLKIVAVYLFWLDRELTCVTRTSKNTVTPIVQTDLLPSYPASDITELYFRGKISYPTFFKGCWSKTEILFKTLISEKKPNLPRLMQNKEAPAKGGGRGV